MRDLLALLVYLLEDDTFEDDEEMQGHLNIKLDGHILILAYSPFPDSPFPALTQCFQIERKGEDNAD